jgi:hypothetical protein
LRAEPAGAAIRKPITKPTITMTIPRLFAIAGIAGCTAAGWFLLGGAITLRSNEGARRLDPEVAQNWGPLLAQTHPQLFHETPGGGNRMRAFAPEASDIKVTLRHEPKRKGLRWYRTYAVDFDAVYQVKNPTPIEQTIYVSFRLPAEQARYDRFSLKFGDKLTDKAPTGGEIRESLLVPAGATVPLQVTYRGSGTDCWTYAFGDARRVKNFALAMVTDFAEINIPAGAESPPERAREGTGWRLVWNYQDVIGAHAVAMDMPAVPNPGQIAGRMTFFAPVSLLFFFAVLVMVSVRRGLDLHPMNYFFLAAGCFAFQLLFAYLVDLLPLATAFALAAVVSLVLVNGYLSRAADAAFARIAALAQFAYMVLFSYSFFFDGLTGITITVGAIVTLALLMAFTAKIDWNTVLRAKRTPPRVPGTVGT